MNISIFTDGGARGNPGPSAGGVVIRDEEHKIIFKSGFFFGVKTNNQAEYLALIKGLEVAKEMGATQIKCFLDSELVVRQLTKEYRVKNPVLKELYHTVVQIIGKFKNIQFLHIPREENNEADALVNDVLDDPSKQIVVSNVFDKIK